MSGTPMKLILTQEVTGLGGPGDVVEVAGGYGRNYLVPRRLAMHWSRGAEEQIELIKRARSAREIRGVDDAKDAASRLGSLQVRMQTRAGSGGRLFGSVAPSVTADAVVCEGRREQAGLTPVPAADAGRHWRSAVRFGVAQRHRRRGEGRGRARVGPAPDRDQEPDQDGRRAPGVRPA